MSPRKGLLVLLASVLIATRNTDRDGAINAVKSKLVIDFDFRGSYVSHK